MPTRCATCCRNTRPTRRGKIRLEEIDPEPFTPEEDEAEALGLAGVHRRRKATSSISACRSPTRWTAARPFPFFTQDREQYLEYDITSAIYRLANPDRPRLGMLSTIPLEAGPGGIDGGVAGPIAAVRRSIEQLAQTFDLKTIDSAADRIPPEVKTLLVVHPAGLSAAHQYAIDQFVMRGGKAIILVDPLSEIMGAQQGAGGAGEGPVSSDLARAVQGVGRRLRFEQGGGRRQPGPARARGRSAQSRRRIHRLAAAAPATISTPAIR